MEDACLFLDLDGTLAPIEARPGDVGPDQERTLLLRRAADALEGRIAVVSGRSLHEIDRILDGSVASAAGLHGLERRSPGGSVHAAVPAPLLERARTEAAAFTDARPGLLLEDKGLSVAIHFRSAPSLRDETETFAMRLADATGLSLQAGKMVFELRTPGFDKGDVVRAFMTEAPFRGGIPIFVGDDLTDEHAFAAASELGGAGILVGPPRQTHARHGLRDVDHVLAWLGQGLDTQVFVVGAAA